MRKSINERIPQSEAKMLAIFDFRVLKQMVAKARIAQESTTGVHLRGEQEDFDEPEDVMFDRDLVIKPLRSHVLIRSEQGRETPCRYHWLLQRRQRLSREGFSQLARIRTKVHNSLKTRNLNAYMSLRLNG